MFIWVPDGIRWSWGGTAVGLKGVQASEGFEPPFQVQLGLDKALGL